MGGMVLVLAGVLGLTIVVCGLLVLVRALERRKTGPPPLALEGDQGDADEIPPVRRRAWVMDHPSEAKFYSVLEAAATQALGPCRVMVQMPLTRLVELDPGLPRGTAQIWRNRIDRKSVDYVVCEASSLRALLAVELDGSSHDAAGRRERDGLVERVLETAGVPLVRFDRRGREPRADEVAQRLSEAAPRAAAPPRARA